MRLAATAACLAALSLAGCAAMSGDGSGPLVLSPQVKAATSFAWWPTTTPARPPAP